MNQYSRRDFPVERLVVVVDGDGELLLSDGEGGRLAALHRQRRQRRAEAAAAEAEEGGAVGSGRGGGGVGGGRGGGSEAVRVCFGWWSRNINTYY